MAPKTQTQLKFDLAAQAGPAAQDITEGFAFRGKSYRATIAGRQGRALSVRADRHKATKRELRAAFDAFRDEHGARIDTLHAERFPEHAALRFPLAALPF